VVEFRSGQARVRVNIPDQATLLAQVGDRLRGVQGFALATLNLDHLVKLRGDSGFAAAYAAQDFVTADGNPVVWLARLGGQRLDLLPGADLILPLVRLAADAGVPVALVGATLPALEGARDALARAVPGVRFGPLIAPPMGFDPASPAAASILAQLAASRTGLCLLALGAPKQEALAARGRALAPGVGFVSIGAGLDFLAGSQTRAPAWVRAIAMEWLWRMLSQPRRLALRYLRCALILPSLARDARRQRG
jgi:exopolysaccharide biosynthesis WecB/TagA/CpsF family protein